jgi:hypothetical protein
MTAERHLSIHCQNPALGNEYILFVADHHMQKRWQQSTLMNPKKSEYRILILFFAAA